MVTRQEKKKKPHYVDNKKFYQEIVKYRQRCDESTAAGKEEPIMPDYLGECIWNIANHLAFKPCFMYYSFRDEMIEDGIENCILYFKSFDPTKWNNPFAYFTQVVGNAFLRRIAKEEKIRYTTYKFFQETILHTSDGDYLVDSDDNHLLPKQMYDNINEFMEKYEKRESAKKQKRKEAKSLNKFYKDKENGESSSTVSATVG